MLSNRVRAAALAMALAAGTPAWAGDYHYTMDGFSGGGLATLDFSASDANGDAALDWYGPADPASDPFTALRLSFSGDTLVAPFNLGLSDILRLHLDATTLSVVGASQSFTLDGARHVFSSYSYVAQGERAIGSAMAMVISPAQVRVSTANQPLPPLSPVPEPETWALVLAGLCVVAFIASRHRPR